VHDVYNDLRLKKCHWL